MINQELLISRITQLSEDELSAILNAVNLMLKAKKLTPKPACPYCGSHAVIRYSTMVSAIHSRNGRLRIYCFRLLYTFHCNRLQSFPSAFSLLSFVFSIPYIYTNINDHNYFIATPRLHFSAY